ncbi:Rho1 guanine nucleotide exchange factor TUS1 [Candida viswanathii]|uniref:Rho1 guanine nucleotide exchange factor TUS1 n=1 Tax=Candida viswanathii TaxID=5486 RepID=A0A367XRL4_9ASCO|nr:Rho1 guanine nucleotide exchange factor TUS1 [Candida viswanathii]
MPNEPVKKSLRRKPPPDVDTTSSADIYLSNSPEQHHPQQFEFWQNQQATTHAAQPQPPPPPTHNSPPRTRPVPQATKSAPTYRSLIPSSPPTYKPPVPNSPPPAVPVQLLLLFDPLLKRPSIPEVIATPPRPAQQVPPRPVQQVLPRPVQPTHPLPGDYSFDDSFVSISDSPKPRGPKQIWEYEDEVDDNSLLHTPVRNTSVNSIDYKSQPRGYQQISSGARSDASGLTPQGPSINTSRSTLESPAANVPYPTTNFEDSFVEYKEPEVVYNFGVPSPSQIRTQEIINKVVSENSPQISDVPDLSSSNRNLIHSNHSRKGLWPSHSRTNLVNSSNSPMYPINTSPFGSPPRPDLRHFASRNSQNFYYNNKTSPRGSAIDYGLDLSYSRSPSPTKPVIDRTKTTSLGFTYRETEYSELADGYNEFGIQHGPSSRWNSIHLRVTYNPETDNVFWDEELHRSSESPATEYFDYTMLPELPVAPKSPPPKPPKFPMVPALKQEEELPSLPLELPELPFSAAFLQSQHYEVCTRIWSLSELFKWCLKLRIWLRDLTITRSELRKALCGLLAFHRREAPVGVINSNATVVFDQFVTNRAIDLVEDPDSEGSDKMFVVMNEHIYVNGVLPLLTECYSNFAHTKEVEKSNMTCYSTCCTLSKAMNLERKMRNTNIKEIVLANDWATHWHFTIEYLRALDTAISKKQSLIFDLIRYEQTFIQRAKCFVEVVAPEFIKAAKNYLGKNSAKLKKFEQDIIDAAKQIIEIHQTVLFEPLLKVLVAEGRYIHDLVSIASAYSAWAAEIRQPMIKYMNCMPMVQELFNIGALKAYADTQISSIPRVRDLKIDADLLFNHTFNSRYSQLTLQLEDIYRKFEQTDPEYISLHKARAEIKELGVKVNDTKRSADNTHALTNIKEQLIWKSGLIQINLHLDSPNRRFVGRGDLTRRSDLKKLQTSSLNHIILLDNYLLITDRSKNRYGDPAYKIIEDPIPVEYLIVEEKSSSSSSSSSGPSSGLTTAVSPMKPNRSPIPPTNGKMGVAADDYDDDTDAFQIKIRYAGRSKRAYTFSCKTEHERTEWVDFFLSTKSSLGKRLKASNPLRVELVSNTVFGYDFSSRVTKLQLIAPFDPIYDVCEDSVKKMAQLNLSKDIYNTLLTRNRIVFSKIQCMSGFEYNGSRYNLVALEAGLFMCEAKGRWKKILGGADYIQIHVDAEIGIVIVLSDKHLRYYPIHQVMNVYREVKLNITGISLSKDTVLFFKMGRHKNVKMLFYAKKKSNGTIHFKVVIPQLDNSGIFSRFKDHARFYIEADCYGISIFNSSFAVHTNKGFEILELDKLIPSSVPELPPPNESDKKKANPYATRKSTAATTPSLVEAIRKLLNANYKPMGMFKLNNNKEFLLVYKDYAIFINKHGKPSRDSIIHFRAQHVHFDNNYLFAINDQLIEVWHIGDQPKIVQVIVGKDVRHLGDNGFAMANPLVPGLQLVIRLVQ